MPAPAAAGAESWGARGCELSLALGERKGGEKIRRGAHGDGDSWKTSERESDPDDGTVPSSRGSVAFSAFSSCAMRDV